MYYKTNKSIKTNYLNSNKNMLLKFKKIYNQFI